MAIGRVDVFNTLLYEVVSNAVVLVWFRGKTGNMYLGARHLKSESSEKKFLGREKSSVDRSFYRTRKKLSKVQMSLLDRILTFDMTRTNT